VRAWCTAIDCGLNPPAYSPVAVPEQRRAVAATEVEVLLAVEVPQARALPAVKEQGVPQGLVHAGRGGDAAGEIPAGLPVLFDNATHPTSFDNRVPPHILLRALKSDVMQCIGKAKVGVGPARIKRATAANPAPNTMANGVSA